MAKFSISKVFGWLKGFLKSMPSPLGGYNMQDVKVNTQGDAYSAMFSFTAGSGDEALGEIENVKGEKIPLNVLLKAINTQEVFTPILNGLNNIGEDDKEDTQRIFDILLGRRSSGEDFAADNTLESAEARGASGSTAGGLLGIDLSKVESLPDAGYDYAGKFWSWKNIAETFLRYSLECQAEGKDYGAIENQTYADCGNLISEYLLNVGLIASIDEVKINQYYLVLPILICIQGKLKEYYSAAYEKYDGKFVDPSFEDEVSEEEYNKTQNPEEPQIETVWNGNEQVDEIDVSTEEGKQMAKEYNAMGYTDALGNPLPVNSAKRISVKLQKIQASEDVKVLALQSDYTPTDTLGFIDDIINQDEFLDVLTEDPQTFDINIDADGYDIDVGVEDLTTDPCESLGEVLRQAIRFYRNLYILHWMAKGNDMMKLHILAEELYGELIQEIDTLGELLVEKSGTVIPLDFECNYLEIKPYEFQESLDIIKANIQMYIDTIDYAYCNQTSDVQSTLDEWLRYWNKEMNYFVKGQEI